MWRVEFEPERSLLTLSLRELVSLQQMRRLAEANARALEATAGEEYRVFVDLRALFPLDEEAAALFAEVRKVASSLGSFVGMAILADSPTVAMQQHLMRVRGGTNPELEVITLDEAEARRFLHA
ncbi:MAG: hypothetical protein OEY14_11125 [Myxococcales bacterium]|nr:hypothetical protein [Myxococcales bacterium]